MKSEIGSVSRRGLLRTAGGFAAANAARGMKLDDNNRHDARGPILAYVGTYTGARVGVAMARVSIYSV